MTTDENSPLLPYGWSERVLALWHDLDDPGLSPGRVVRVDRTACVVAAPDGPRRSMVVAGGQQVAVGDWVATATGTVHRVLPRWSVISRRDPSGAGMQVLAANVDVVFVTAPADRLSAARVERELAVVWEGGALPVVVLTKADLAGPGAFEELAARLVGADVVAVSSRDGLGLDELRARLRPSRTAALLGPSGAGKSTLANALLGAGVQDTGPVRADDGRGRHTTTARQLLAVPGGGVLIDTPGLRSLGLAGVPDFDEVFPEIDELARECRFRDCAHASEPGCAVADAVESGVVEAGRLESFKKLLREASADRVRHDPVARQAAQRVWKQRTKDTRMHDKRRPR